MTPEEWTYLAVLLFSIPIGFVFKRGGPFFRYRTHLDWLQQPDSQAIPSWRPLVARARLVPVYGLLFLGAAWLFPLEYVRSEAFAARALPFRLFYMVPVFFVFRMRFYVAWLCADAEEGAPGAAPPEYDYETIKNIDPYGTDFCVRVRDGMRYWNMSVQWWLAQYIYKSAPFRSYVMRSGWTMLISAYWHGLHPGYYLSFLTIPLCLAAEGAMEAGLRGRRGAAPEPEPDRSWGAWLHWFLKMRAYDYMCMGFVLLELGATLQYWRSVYFCVHLGALALLLLGRALPRPAPPAAQGPHRE
ncbi:hypothetical protein KIL84_001758 [Mauremys mutica]|uniref:Leukocyte receptor cluster member 4 n=1 Tax=Mauremys mutica TaxID=74926 RepID=A0A9D4B565_9SAUR|nr:hypothetical protein KIL84_001758 [Mauremys mutica]